jgi:hypothetical protein
MLKSPADGQAYVPPLLKDRAAVVFYATLVPIFASVESHIHCAMQHFWGI